MEPLIIQNRGQEIASTNYWDSPHARAGKLYLSWNAGAARLLVPVAAQHILAEARTAKHVIVSRGPSLEHGGADALELLFEDSTDSPFVVLISIFQTDRLLPASEHPAIFPFCVWTRAGLALQLPGMHRVVEALPCLRPWEPWDSHGMMPD